jgi:phage shock protein PspC (stress-responsive transcriptional regulator)
MARRRSGRHAGPASHTISEREKQTMTDQPPNPDEHEQIPPAGPPEQPAAEEPTAEQPTRQAPAPEPPRRLVRSRTHRVIAGVCGGLAEYLRVDPVIVRVVAVALVFAGGAGVLLYLAAMLLVPKEGEGGGPAEAPGRAVTIAGVVVLVVAIGVVLPFHGGWWGGGALVLGLVALAGLVVWRLASGERYPKDVGAILRASALGVGLLALCGALALGAGWAAAAGGGDVVAGTVIAAGALLVAGAFLDRRARWLILLALAIALPAGVVSAADIDVTGGTGERTYRPAGVTDVRDAYRVGVGRLVVDLRGAHLPPGDRHVKLGIGVGEALLLVAPGVCVSSAAHVGVGGVSIFDRSGGGVDVAWEDQRSAPSATPRLIVDGDVGVGALIVSHRDDQHAFDGGFHREHGETNGACA